MSSRTTCWFWHASNWPRANATKKAVKLAPDRNRASLCRTFGINRGCYETQQFRNPADLAFVLPPEWPRLTKTGVSGWTLANVQGHLTGFLMDNPRARILIEGYTDNVPVKSPVTDYKRYCTVYDDNITLSAARAREARRALIGTLDAAAAQRIVVAGYGESRPLSGIEPGDSRNRRVEVQLVME